MYSDKSIYFWEWLVKMWPKSVSLLLFLAVAAVVHGILQSYIYFLWTTKKCERHFEGLHISEVRLKNQFGPPPRPWRPVQEEERRRHPGHGRVRKLLLILPEEKLDPKGIVMVKNAAKKFTLSFAHFNLFLEHCKEFADLLIRDYLEHFREKEPC